MPRPRLLTSAIASGLLSVGLAVSALAPATAAVPAGSPGICPTVLANATLYSHGGGGFIPFGTVHKGDIWATDGIPDIDGFTAGIDRSDGGRGWVLESTPMGDPFVSCILP